MLGPMESPGAGFEATTASGPLLAAADDPRSATLALRAQPVVKMNDTMVLVTRRCDVEWALRQPQLFSSGMGRCNWETFVRSSRYRSILPVTPTIGGCSIRSSILVGWLPSTPPYRTWPTP